MSEIDFEELDCQLAELVDQAKQAKNALERRRSLNQLLRLLSQPRVLHPPQRTDHPPGVHRDLYNETCQRVWLYICCNIEKYDPQRASVRKWVNFLIDKRFIDVVKERNGKRITYVSDISELDNAAPEEAISDAQILREYLSQDSTGEFREKHLRGHSEANFQAIALRRLDNINWDAISAEFKIPVSSLSTFYQRCLENKKILQLLKEPLNN